MQGEAVTKEALATTSTLEGKVSVLFSTVTRLESGMALGLQADLSTAAFFTGHPHLPDPRSDPGNVPENLPDWSTQVLHFHQDLHPSPPGVDM